MRALLAKFGILSSTLLPSHVLPRDEGRIWTTPQDSVNGSFIFPRTYPLAFRDGSSINISWSKSYESINLYFYQRGKVANSVQLVANFATEWYQWEVRAEETNLTNPFVFRIVNAQGTTEEQNTEGFWSTSWYLTREDNASESSAASPTTATSSTASSSSATSSSSSSKNPISTTQGTKTEATVAPSTEADTHDKGVGKGTIIGLTVGLVVMGATIIAGLLYYLRKRQRSKDALSSAPLPAASYYDNIHVQKQPGHHTVHEVFAQPSELQSVSPCYELPSQK
ncbi:Nn.00g098110.m01.CDS01 [Neocucurbitaria sp. VM-36]